MISSRTCCAVFLLLLTAGRASAQVVQGTIRDASDQPLRGAFVRLHSAEGRQVAAVLAGERGEFRFFAPPGRYRISAELIGYQTGDAGPFELATGQALVRPIVLQVAALRLGELRVTGANRCRGRPDGSGETAALWEEARKALTVAAWVDSSSTAVFRVRHYERDTDLELREVAQPRMRFASAAGRLAYRAQSVDSLDKYGFVQTRRGETFLYGPDADVLLSNTFLEQHCFRLERSRDHAGLVGLKFEPVSGRRLPDIAGVLWLDENTAALRFIEYSYTNFPIPADPRYAGGRTEFERLPNGAWVVRRWHVRAPRLGRLRQSDQLRVVGAHEEGGEILDAQIAGVGAITLVPRVSIEGIVFDSVHKRPLERAQVYLSGTSFRTTSGEGGRFRLDSIPAGAYYLAFTHPRLDSLPEYPVPVPVQATSDVHNVIVSTPSVDNLLGRLCPADEWDPVQKLSGDTLSVNRGFFYGTVNTPNGPMLGIALDAKWTRVTSRSDRLYRLSDVTVKNASIGVTTDDQGGFAICRLPLDRKIEVHVRQREVTLARDTINIPPSGLYRRDYLIRRAQASTDVRVRFIGRVVDADTRDPLAAVSIRIADKTLMTDRNGRFVVMLPRGTHPISVERIGYAPRQDSVSFADGESGDLEIPLSRKPVTLPPITVVGRSEWLAVSGYYDRRDNGGYRARFIGKQEIERRIPTMLTDLLNDIPSVQIYNNGVGRQLVRLNRTGPGGLQRRSRFPGCEPALFIDGRRHLDRNSTADPAVDDFNVLTPIAIEAIEIYTGNTPVEFKSDCGAIVIWTQRGR